MTEQLSLEINPREDEAASTDEAMVHGDVEPVLDSEPSPDSDPDFHSDPKKTLLKHPNLWRAGQLAGLQAQGQKGIATGYAQLDEHLPGKGWPGGGLMEFMLTSAGIGELRLLTPALRTLSHAENRWVAWVNPPFVPYAPALQAAGIDTSRILLIHPRNHIDGLWALERACKSGNCSAALAWLDERKLKLKDTQRLQLAAKQGRTLSCLFRPQAATSQSSMAELRLALRAAAPGEVQLDILKRRGGWPLHNLLLPVADITATRHRDPAEVQQQLNIWRAMRQQPNTRVAEDAETPEAVMHPPPGGDSTVRVH